MLPLNRGKQKHTEILMMTLGQATGEGGEQSELERIFRAFLMKIYLNTVSRIPWRKESGCH